MTSTELAAWVQAIGSIAAVLGAAFAAIYQSKKQHESALKVQKEERRYARIELTKSLLQLARNCEGICRHFIRLLDNDRSNIYDIAEGRKHLDVGELARAEQAVLAIPLHSLPAKLVTYTMWVHSTVRQFREKVETALQHHRGMQAEHFEDLFRSITEMQEGLSKTLKDIEAELAALSDEAAR
jgi:hypothetical protein